MHDPIADFLTRIKNAQHARLETVEAPYSKLKEAVAKILVREGYIAKYEILGDKKKVLRLTLKYHGKQGVIEGIKRVSKPGCREYVSANKIPRVLGGLGVAILTTSKGILTDREARRMNVGGEVICYIW